jgi:hypothetical protein
MRAVLTSSAKWVLAAMVLFLPTVFIAATIAKAMK